MGPSTTGGHYPSSQHHFSPPYMAYSGGTNGSHGPSSSGVVELPPKIDRSSKPTRLARSAQERLFGSREGDINGLDIDTYPTSPPGPAPAQAPNGVANHPSNEYLNSLRGSSLDRDRAAKAVRQIGNHFLVVFSLSLLILTCPTGFPFFFLLLLFLWTYVFIKNIFLFYFYFLCLCVFQGSYDSSSSSYESYNRLGLTLSLAGNNHQNGGGGGEMNGIPGSPSSGGVKSHDPYRYTRSTSQPVRSPTEPTSPATKQHHRYVTVVHSLSPLSFVAFVGFFSFLFFL